MTPEELIKLVQDSDVDGLAEACASLTEAQRRKLSKTATQLDFEANKREWSNAGFDAILPQRPQRIPLMPVEAARTVRVAGQLAVLACGPLSAAKQFRVLTWAHDASPIPMAKILIDRRPAWIDDWVDAMLKRPWSPLTWDTVRALITNGVCRKPTGGEYIVLMVHNLRWEYKKNGKYSTLEQTLLADRGLLDDEIWRIFQVETGAFRFMGHPSLTSESHQDDWPATLKRLAAAGHIDRQRLLDACLNGLMSGLKNDMLTDFTRFHDYLEPTDEELQRLQPVYMELLASSAPHVVTFALRMLKTIDKAGFLDGERFLRSVASVFAIRTKTQPKSALLLIQRIVKRDGALAGRAAAAVGEALAHEAPDIQEQALDLLETFSKSAPDDAAQALRIHLAEVAPSRKARAEALLAPLDGSANAAGHDGTGGDLLEREKILLERAQAIPAAYRTHAGVDDMVRSLADGVTPPPLSFEVRDARVLTGVERIEPITDVDELIDVVAHAMETIDNADEFERIMDGISRLCDQKPDNFEARTDAIVRRIAKTAEPTAEHLPPLLADGPENTSTLLMAWLRRDATRARRWRHEYESGPAALWEERLRELALRVAAEKTAPLLAAPTHRGGWIDPRQFIGRLLFLQGTGIETPHADVIQALLRLAPEYRVEALDAAGTVEGHIGRAVRWALGGEVGPTRLDWRFPQLWPAAGRSRWPSKQLDELSELELEAADPDGIVPAAYNWTSTTTISRVPWRNHHVPDIKISVSPCGTVHQFPVNHPTVEMHWRDHLPSYGYGFSKRWLVHWVGLTWPAKIDAVFVAGVGALMTRIDEPPAGYMPNHAYLELLDQPDRPWSDMARLALCVGLIGRDAGARGVAIDMLIEAIADGRAHPHELGEVCARIGRGGWMKTNRLASALGEVARLSHLNAHFVSAWIDRYIVCVDEVPSDVHHLLELLLELDTSLGLPFSLAARLKLGEPKGSSKTAKLIRGLRKLDAAQPTDACREALHGYLAGRISRGERWTNG